ncbi:uncharacterized protein [Rutidosis leptorrhynchoides]|uniref:uncharacterized protein n=1 Tax=Rutidosis leptorrhynchoides TaxID=125765 RepID=UPI003A9A4C22
MEEEIREAVWDCGSSKAPGPNGFTIATGSNARSKLPNPDKLLPKRSQPLTQPTVETVPEHNLKPEKNKKKRKNKVTEDYWGLVKEDLVAAISKAFIDFRLPKGARLTFITLILYWHPVNLEKGYDSVSWSFLDSMLEILSFGNKGSAWVYMCLVTAKTSILVNGSPMDKLLVQRGLRQGDPLSPLFFIFDRYGGPSFGHQKECISSLNVNVNTSNLFRFVAVCVSRVTNGANMGRITSGEVMVERFEKRLASLFREITFWLCNTLNFSTSESVSKSVHQKVPLVPGEKGCLRFSLLATPREKTGASRHLQHSEA